jgi:hypothetical protein
MLLSIMLQCIIYEISTGMPVSNILEGKAHTPLPLGSAYKRCKFSETILTTRRNTSFDITTFPKSMNNSMILPKVVGNFMTLPAFELYRVQW